MSGDRSYSLAFSANCSGRRDHHTDSYRASLVSLRLSKQHTQILVGTIIQRTLSILLESDITPRQGLVEARELDDGLVHARIQIC